MEVTGRTASTVVLEGPPRTPPVTFEDRGCELHTFIPCGFEKCRHY